MPASFLIAAQKHLTVHIVTHVKLLFYKMATISAANQRII